MVRSVAEDDGFLEVLVKEIPTGLVSPALRRVKPGEELTVDGPFGSFTIDRSKLSDRRSLLIATGTGISPFHSFARSYPGLNYQLLHGIATPQNRYGHEAFEPSRVVSCTTRDPEAVSSHQLGGNSEQWFEGRVTTFLLQSEVNPDTHCYLCGNCDMIYEAFDILKAKGIPIEQLFAEVYF
jgi:ferredoxin--NADP+ reductase